MLTVDILCVLLCDRKKGTERQKERVSKAGWMQRQNWQHPTVIDFGKIICG